MVVKCDVIGCEKKSRQLFPRMIRFGKGIYLFANLCGFHARTLGVSRKEFSEAKLASLLSDL